MDAYCGEGAMGKAKKHIFNSDETVFDGDGDVELCSVCHQEFT